MPEDHDVMGLPESLRFVADLGAKAAEVAKRPDPLPLVELTVQGRPYWVEDDHEPILEPCAEGYHVLSLHGLAMACAEHAIEGRTIVVGDPKVAILYGPVHGVHRQRDMLCAASAETGASFPYGKFLEPDVFIIAARVAHQESEPLRRLLSLVSGLSETSSVTVSDDGVGQAVEIKQGISLQQRVDISNVFTLAPWRTFAELDQPESPFFVRLRSERGAAPMVALFEVNDPTWRPRAVARIVSALEAMINEEIADPTLRPVIIG